MPRTSRPAREAVLLRAILSGSIGPEDLEGRLDQLHTLRVRSEAESKELDRALLVEHARKSDALTAAQLNRKELEAILGKLTTPPFHPAVYLGSLTVREEPLALVSHGNTRRAVVISDDVEANALEVGDEVLLSSELNVLLEHTPCPALRSGQTALFDRRISGGRVVLNWRDDEIVVNASERLRRADLTKGDEVRWSEDTWIASEKIESGKGDHLFLEDTPADTFDDVGGLDAEIEELKNLFLLHVKHPEAVRAYGLRRKGAVLLEGPPGNGKTMIARALANWLAGLSKSGRVRFINVKPGSLGSMWYSQAEKNVRDVFRIARDAGRAEPDVPVILFMDEIDHIGTIRGHFNGRIDDKVQNAIMVELDGLEGRGNVMVIGATNRRDSLDPALIRPGRLGDRIIEIPRPGRKAAHGIFRKHLRAGIPVVHNGSGPDEAREEVIDSALSRLYSPNGEGELAILTFRDGKKQDVRAPEMISGAGIARIANDAVEAACVREVGGGERGLRLGDVFEAIDHELDDAARVLTPANCRHHLRGLPQDVDVVSVESRRTNGARSQRSLSVG